jgi:uncharacterized cupin superfamily protein
MAGGLVHWDDVEPVERAAGHIRGRWQYLGEAAGSVTVGCNRVRLEPGAWSTPAHVDLANEEIFYVLAGSGLSWQDGTVYEVRTGDCIVHRIGREAHTLRAGPDGLDYLVYGGRTRIGSAYLPRVGVMRPKSAASAWLEQSWFHSGGGEHPWKREASAGEPEVGEPAERPANIVNVDALEPDEEGDRVVAGEAGATQAGLHHRTLQPGKASVPAHTHSSEEEIFVVLEGTVTYALIPTPRLAHDGVLGETHELRAGHIVCRPGGTRMCHDFHGGPDGATMLVYGTRDPNDIAYYPRSNKINFRGVGLIARLDALEYADGETEFGG